MTQTYKQLAETISNIRYGKLGTIEFDRNGRTHIIAEPVDVLLVGFDDKLAALWIAQQYSFLLAA